MKISIIRHSIRNRGGDKIPYEYGQYLAGKGHKIVYWVNEIKTTEPLDERIEFKKIPWPGKTGTIFFTLLTNFKSDTVLVDLAAMSLFASLRNKKSVIMLAQDFDVSYYSSKLLQKIVSIIYWIIFRVLNTPVIIESESLFNKLKTFKPRRYIISPIGIDLNFYKRKTDSSSGSKEKSVILLAVWQDYRKGIDIAKKALIELKNIRDQADWEIWTIGEKLDPIDNIKIINHGFLKSEKLKEIFSATDIYLMPSRSEGLSLLLLTALAMECCVVATEAANIITHQTNGLVSPIEDWSKLSFNLNRALEDKTLRKKLKTEARLLAEQFDVNKSKAHFEQSLYILTNLKKSKKQL